MRRRLTLLTALLVAATLTVRAFYGRGDAALPGLTTDALTRGPVVVMVSATGTLEALTTVQVGSQVSGTVEALFADFNSIVKKGQVLARLDQSLYRSAIDQAEANLLRASADADRARITLEDTGTKLARARELAARQLIPANELDTAELNRATAASQVKSAAAAVTQAQAALKQAQVNHAKTVITSPIDGIVISRDVDVGQTVAASFSAPTLFVLAADLTQMTLNASIDESDLGVISQGQPVAFRVDAYPNDTFRGVVKQVRLNPVVQANVVTYAAIISAPNPQRKLMPGMTANLTIEVARREDVLRAPAAALRFRPSADVLRAYKAPADGGPGKTVLWTIADGALAAVPVQTGLSDGTWTELTETSLSAGAEVITRAATQTNGGSAAGASANPLLGAQPQRRP